MLLSLVRRSPHWTPTKIEARQLETSSDTGGILLVHPPLQSTAITIQLPLFRVSKPEPLTTARRQHEEVGTSPGHIFYSE